jgi:hypothetical protein
MEKPHPTKGSGKDVTQEKKWPGMVVYAIVPGSMEAEAGGST